jgi:alginate O-acetyltransferase complex protein AlgI
MAYHSMSYLVFFLPVVLLLYQAVLPRYRWCVLLAGSYYFYYGVSGMLIVYLLAATLIIHGAAVWMELERAESRLAMESISPEDRRNEKERLRIRIRKILLWGLCIPVGILIWKKYYNFGAVNLNRLLCLFPQEDGIPLNPVVLPIGLSFYTLQAAGYLMDVWRGTIRAERNPGKLALFLAFFSLTMEGPICRYGQIEAALFQGKPLTLERLSLGGQRILWGLWKKMLVADRLDILVKNVYGNYQSYDGAVIAVAAVSYTVQLYMEFSGCMDMVIGSAELFGICLPENFRQPFFSRTVSEFWRRWHISLGTWFKDYIFYPVSMSTGVKKIRVWAKKKSAHLAKACVSAASLFPVWLCNGLWHGPRWSFIFFGMYYFVLIASSIIMEPWYGRLRSRLGLDPDSRVYHGFQMLRTWVLVVVGELFFRAEGLGIGAEMFCSVLTRFRLSSLWDGTLLGLGLDLWDFRLIAGVLLAVFLVSCVQEKGQDVRQNVRAMPLALRWCVYYGVMISLCVFGAYGPGYGAVDFIYAGF